MDTVCRFYLNIRHGILSADGTALKGWMGMYVKDNPRYVLAISVAEYILLG